MEQPRYGYRRLAVLIKRESAEPVNEKRVHLLYREAGLALRRIKRKRMQRSAVPLVKLSGTNQEWAMDFVQDWAANGQVLRFLAVVDQYTRKCVRLVADTSIPSARVIRELKWAMAEHGKPARLRMDKGSEFTSRTFLAWCVEEKIEMVHIRPGKPVEKAYASYCTSCKPQTMFSIRRRRFSSLTPCAFRGGLGPGSSYSQSSLSFDG